MHGAKTERKSQHGDLKMPKTIVLNFFPQEKVELLREVNRHPMLKLILADTGLGNNEDDWPGVLGHVAAYCNIEMDGMYTPDDLIYLYHILTLKLIKKRSIIIMPTVKGD